ncbi:MAG TPA: hypothetical protein V6D22_23780 [Candidatus Obscuribacterales bacterium]
MRNIESRQFNLERVYWTAVNYLQTGWTTILPPRLRYAMMFGQNHAPMMKRLKKMRRRTNRLNEGVQVDPWMRLRTEERLNRGQHGWFETRVIADSSNPMAMTRPDRRFAGVRMDFDGDIAAMRVDNFFGMGSQASPA